MPRTEKESDFWNVKFYDIQLTLNKEFSYKSMHWVDLYTFKLQQNNFERWRTDAFELWCWRRLLRALWTARGSNQSILKKIIPEYSLDGLMLKLQYFGHLMWRTALLEKTLMLGQIEGRRRGRQRMTWLDGITDSMDMSLSETLGQGGLVCCNSWGRKESDTTEWLNWTEEIFWK